jgi:RND family efflux transporter MFP subunit
MRDMTRHARRGAVLGAALVLAGCAKKAEEAEKTPQAVVTAKTFVAAMEPFTRTISAIGTVVARPGSFAALSAPSAARIAKVLVAPGQRVGMGTTLVEFEQQSFTAAASAAVAALNAAEKTYDRAQRLAAEGIVPRKDVEQAAAELGKARSDAVLAQRAQQLSVLRSPLNGVITNLKAVLGASTDAGQVLVEIADPSAFDVVLSLAASDASGVLPGSRVALTAGEKSGGEILGDGRVASVGATVDTLSRAVSVRVTVARPRRPLRLSENVYGVIALSTHSAIVVPTEALVPGEEVGTYKVYVVSGKGIATGRDVKIGGRDEARVEIVDGLKAGEKVVSQGAYAVQDSASVTKELPVKDSTEKPAAGKPEKP